MRSGTIVLALAFVAGSSALAVDMTETPGTAKVVKHAFGPGSWARAAAAAGIDQARDTPHEWGQGAAGFGRRIASGFGKHLVKTGIQYPMARLLHEEFGYQRSGKQGFKPRLLYALESTIITRKTTTKKRTLSTSELAGAFGSGFISRLWQPASMHTVASGFASAGITLGADAGGNVVKEFWPEIRHPRRHSQSEPNALP